MKTLKSIALGLVLLTVFGVAKASNKPAVVLSKDYVINTYIDAVSHGKTEGLKDVFDSFAKFSMLRGNKVVNYTKAEMLTALQASRGVEQNCSVTTSETESGYNTSVVKVDMKYAGFVRTNYVTITNTDKGWKITNVYSEFK